MYSHVARTALRRAMVSSRPQPKATVARAVPVYAYPAHMVTITVRHVSSGQEHPSARVTAKPEWSPASQSESEADLKADHTNAPLRDLTEETIEYVHERYDTPSSSSSTARVVRRKPAPEEWNGERASESETDVRADKTHESVPEMTEETIEYVHERYDRRRVVDASEWDQNRESESEADVKADHTTKPLDELTEDTIEFVQEHYKADARKKQ